MKKHFLVVECFWRAAVPTALTLVAAAVAAWAAPAIFSNPLGRFPASMIAVARSRAILDNAGVNGYYERLFETAPPYQANRLSHLRIFDRYRLTRIRPNSDSSVNRFGFSGPEYSLQKPSGTRRIVLLGDSLTQGAGVESKQTYGNLLQNRMNAALPSGGLQRVEVVNLAIGGYQITQILDIALVDAPRFQPDAYVLALTELAVFRNWNVHLVQLIQQKLDPKYDFLREVIGKAGAVSGDDSLTLFSKLAPYRIQVLREALTRIKARAAQDHAPFIVLLMPSVEDGDLCRKRFGGIPEVLAALDIPVIDLLDAFHDIPDLDPLRINSSDVHPNARGHAMIFERLFARLQMRPDVWKSLAGGVPMPPRTAARGMVLILRVISQ